MGKWEDITDVLTPEGIEKIKTGEILMFNFEGSKINLKVRRKSKGKVYAERVTLHRPSELTIIDKQKT